MLSEYRRILVADPILVRFDLGALAGLLDRLGIDRGRIVTGDRGAVANSGYGDEVFRDGSAGR
jgi:hypothetical protein